MGVISPLTNIPEFGTATKVLSRDHQQGSQVDPSVLIRLDFKPFAIPAEREYMANYMYVSSFIPRSYFSCVVCFIPRIFHV